MTQFRNARVRVALRVEQGDVDIRLEKEQDGRGDGEEDGHDEQPAERVDLDRRPPARSGVWHYKILDVRGFPPRMRGGSLTFGVGVVRGEEKRSGGLKEVVRSTARGLG